MIQNKFSFFISVLALHALLIAPAQAGERLAALTENNVKEFIEKTTDITTGQSHEDDDDIADYLDKHLEKNARFKSVMKYNMPGMPPQETALSLSKAEYMESVAQGAHTVGDYETLIEIKEIKIASNGKKAFVKTQSTEQATMPIPLETGGTQDVPIEGVSNCTQILSLNNGIIQMFSATCTTNINFLEY